MRLIQFCDMRQFAHLWPWITSRIYFARRNLHAVRGSNSQQGPAAFLPNICRFDKKAHDWEQSLLGRVVEHMQRYAWPATAWLVRFFTVDEPARFCRIGQCQVQEWNLRELHSCLPFSCCEHCSCGVSHMMASWSSNVHPPSRWSISCACNWSALSSSAPVVERFYYNKLNSRGSGWQTCLLEWLR